MITKDKYVPSGWHWEITPEQVEKIKANDLETINRVYFDNYYKFERIAKHYCYKVRRQDCLQDCLQQIYVDLPIYKYDEVNAFYLSLKRSFRYACGLYKGMRYQDVVSLDSLTRNRENGDKRALSCFISAPERTDTDRQEDERHVLKMIAAQTRLTDNGRDYLTSVAFDCKVYKGLFDYEYKKMFTV